MPPKKKEKGGKGGPTGANALEEPPQPAPGTPHCLRLSLEVCLDAAESDEPGVHAGDKSDVAAEGSGDEKANQKHPHLVAPYLRYTFVNGDKITTPPIGLPGSSWHKLSGERAGDLPFEEASTGLPDKEQVTAFTDERFVQSASPKVVAWRYTRIHQLRGGGDEKVALALDRGPHMRITLADRSSVGATAQPPGPGLTGGSGNESAHLQYDDSQHTIPGRNFIDAWHMDLSSFLSGEECVVVGVGDVPAQADTTVKDGGSLVDGARPSCIHNNDVVDATYVQRIGTPPAPTGIRYLRIEISTLPGVAAARGDVDARGVKSANEDVSGEHAWSALFSAETLLKLNPLSIKITSAAALPGVRVDAVALQKHVQPTRFRLLETHCKPVHIFCRPFAENGIGRSLHSRVMWTAGAAQSDRVFFDHTSSFIVGSMDRHSLEEWAETSTLSIEVHDRDPKLTAEEKKAKVLRLERLVSGGYPVDDDTQGIDRSALREDAIDQATSGGTETRFEPARDIYEVDAIALEEDIAEAELSGKENAHGVASFRLSGLLDQSRQLTSAFRSSKEGSMRLPATSEPMVSPSFKLRSNICQRKRRELPKGGVETWHLTDEQRLVRHPGAYVDAESSLGIRLTLARPLRTLQEGSAERTGSATEEPRPFTKAFFVVEYEEGGELVREISEAMEQLNGRALKNVQGSLRAYRLTAEEKNVIDAGTLDILCGFMVVDEDSRTIVVEGAAGPRGTLKALMQRLGRASPNGQAYRVLYNPEVRFSARLYTCFDADLKKIRLRDPLPILCTNPEIYNRSKVSADCFEALQSLRMLRKANRMREAAEHALFPEPAQLLQVESKYGESISVQDITGRNPVKKRRNRTAGVESRATVTADAPAHVVAQLASRGDIANTKAAKEAPQRRKAPTDASNIAFEEWLKDRNPRNFLTEQEHMSAQAYARYLIRRRRRQEEVLAETVSTEWCYGPQALNYVELKKAEMRGRLSKDKGATYTYSADYVSQTVSLVDEFRVREEEEIRSKATWKTKRGFVWPHPRTRQELIEHPRKPSGSRIDTLREPWVENELRGGRPDEMAGVDLANTGPPELAWRREFDAVPSNGKTVFGGLQIPKYARTLDTSMIGSRTRLPRGEQYLEKDPNFFRSVHLVGEGLAAEKEEAKQRVRDSWLRKVVVDDTDFRVGNFSVRNTPLQVDRAKDILRLPIKKAAFKMVHNVRLPSGKRVSFSSPPISASSLEPYKEPDDFTGSIRNNHREHWTATDPVTDEKLGFSLRLHKDRMKKKSHRAFARLKHPPLTASERRGPCWETGRELTNERTPL